MKILLGYFKAKVEEKVFLRQQLAMRSYIKLVMIVVL
jgi:hypothetical protein